MGTSSLSGGNAAFSTSSLGAGTHTITARYGGATEFAGATSGGVSEQVNLVATTTTLNSSSPSTVSGSPVTFTAVVSSDHGTPTGTVTFADRTTVIGTGTLSGGTAIFVTSNLSVGSHLITATYGGDDTTFAVSTSTAVVLTVTKTPTLTTLSSSPNPSMFGQAITFSATVTATLGTPTGAIQFMDGSTVIGTAALSGTTATLKIEGGLSVGTHQFTASYSGDATSEPSTSSPDAQIVHRREPRSAFRRPPIRARLVRR